LEKEVKRMRAVVEGEETLALEKEKQLQKKEEKLGITRDQLKDRQSEYKPLSDLAKTLLDAKIQFDRLDANKNGVLESLEILDLADWCWEQFGRKIRRREKIRMTDELIAKADTNQDGKIDFDEFAEWFVSTINDFKRKEKENCKLTTFDDSSEDEDDGDDDLKAISPRIALIRDQKKKNGSNQSTKQWSRASPDQKANERTVQVQSPSKSKDRPDSFRSYSPVQKARPSPRVDPIPKIQELENAEGHLTQPWHKLAGSQNLSKSRVQLFLRLNLNKDKKNTLGMEDIKELLLNCGVKSGHIGVMTRKFCTYFKSNTQGEVNFQEFEAMLSNKCNEKDLYEIVQKLSAPTISVSPSVGAYFRR